MDALTQHRAIGRYVRAGDDEVFLADTGGDGPVLLFLHGFPSSSFDLRAVLPQLSAAGWRVVMPDLPGYGLSAKPDRPYSLFGQADVVEAVAREASISSCALLTHDMGDSVGGEILARSMDGSLGFDITSRVITNGSIYMDLVQLSAGQQLMLALPDARLSEEQTPGRELYTASLAATFAPDTQPSQAELDAQWELATHNEGNRLLPRLIRYVEERRVHEARWTGAIEKHPSPLSIVWGEVDPIAVVEMARRLSAARPDANLEILEGIGHYPMIEAPDAFARAVLAGLSAA